MIQQWDFPVDEPVSLSEWRQHRLTEHLPAIGARIEQGETLRAIAAEYGVSHETLRQALKRAGHPTKSSPTQATPLRRRLNVLPGRGRSTALMPGEIAALSTRRQAGESIRSLARSYGVSHETVRRYLSRVTFLDSQSASA